MKTHLRFILILFIGAVLFGNINAQTENEAIKNTLTKLFELSKADNYEGCTKMIVYTGTDAKRDFVDTYNFKDRKEAKKVKRICKKIKALINITDNYNFTKSTKESKNGNEVYTQLVEFKSSGQQLTTKFEFVLVADKYLLLSVK